MTDDEFEVLQANSALGIACMNGIITILVRLKATGEFGDHDLEAVYEMMSKPLALADFASNPHMQEQQRMLDDLFATMTRPKGT